MSQKYFVGLNYSLANEDTTVEYELLPNRVDSVFSVCGSGSRVLPLLAKNPSELHVVDLSEAQLRLLRLRLGAVRRFSYDEFLCFLGYRKTSRRSRVEMLRELGLSQEDWDFWYPQRAHWEHQGFIYLGKWERHFMLLGRLFQKLTFSRLYPIFEARSFEEQQKILGSYWRPEFFRSYTEIVMNEWVANKLLYKGHYAGGKGKKTMDVSAAEFVFREFDDLFRNTWVRANYFLQMIFLNEVVFPEALPFEARQEVFSAMKNAGTKVHLELGNVLEHMNHRAHDFYSLSDTFSYMQDQEVNDFLCRLPKNISSGSQIVIRTFMRKPTFKVSVPWVTDRSLNLAQAKRDCTRMYEFTILKKS